MKITDYVSSIYEVFPFLQRYDSPWSIINSLADIIVERIDELPASEYKINGAIAIHNTARVDKSAHIQGPAILAENCLIGPNAFLRDGVFVGKFGIVGYCSEVKQSLIFEQASIAHLNYVGDSIIGARVALEAGAVVLNYFNEREDKTVFVRIGEELVSTATDKFGALIGDDTNIGGNAALSPGTILLPFSIVERGEIVQQA